ncbi:formate C-acetyltransferase/glycerol dehydratase family glycyl radical enzyme [Geoglobus acetivorans]|uniref:Formate C-acetyltransferase/glycerol dehydratase family glycyl radical enzyme n=1 Tax=Geoglobus acetivorans TaxID=565033 RepID=A0ABZ3H1L3_GEOAI|nr:formate C-acetyltransferase/glycerol dehydratase family glycyl radical enzyme [Geoglobus acetivorans]
MDRISVLVSNVQKPARLSIERAVLYTESMKESEGEPMPVRQAKALRHVLENIPIQILPGEIVVGTMLPDPPGAILFPEGVGLRIINDLESLPERESNRLMVSEEDARVLVEEIAPYWESRNIEAFASRLMPDIMEVMLSGSLFVLTELAGISHVAVNYPYLLRRGFRWFVEESERRIAEIRESGCEDARKLVFYEAAKIAAEGIIRFAERYAELARKMAEDEDDESRREELLKVAEICEKVPAKPPESFHEAVQFVWFVQCALHQENYEQGISMGRIDQYLLPYYLRDVREGRLSKREAFEILANLWVKPNEIVPPFDSLLELYFSGQATNQALTIGGVDSSGNDATNELSYLMLEVTEAVPLRQPNVHVRVSSKTPDDFLRKLAEIIAEGKNNVGIFNDETVFRALRFAGVEEGDAWNYSTVGCVEISPFGNAFTSSDAALINVAKALEYTLNSGQDMVFGYEFGVKSERSLKTLEDVITAFREQLAHIVGLVVTGSNILEYANACVKPTPLLSLCVEDCFERGMDVTEGGAKYNFTGIQAVGIADVADSLAAIEHALKKGYTLEEIIEACRSDFDGYEELQSILLSAPKYGNDGEADRYARMVLEMYCDEVARYRNFRGGRFTAGCYPMTTNVAFGFMTSALPSGRKQGTSLNSGVAPSTGMDREGVTAAIKSASKINYEKLSNGASFTVNLDSGILGSKGEGVIRALIRSFVELGGMHIQFNVLNENVLRKAQEEPEKYRWLLVRVAGWSAYFVELSRNVQDELIARISCRL